MLVIRVQKPFMRGTKRTSVTKAQVRVHHAHVACGKVQAHAVGDTIQSARDNATRIMGIHVHAMNAYEAINRVPLTVGVPEHYRLANIEV